MQIRIVRLSGRQRVVGAALLIVVVGLVLAAVVLGLVLLAGLAAVGGVALLARRLLGTRRSAPASRPVLDPTREIFPTRRADARSELPPGAG